MTDRSEGLNNCPAGESSCRVKDGPDSYADGDRNKCLEKGKNNCTEKNQKSSTDTDQISCTKATKVNCTSENEPTCADQNSCIEINDSCTNESEITAVDESKLVEGGQNSCKVRCRECGSLVLSEWSAGFLRESHPLPTPAQSCHAPSPTTHDVCKWWVVDDMFTFDNIGFSHTVGNVKYLVCANCEHGPLGWHDTTSRRSYVALIRVNNICEDL